MLRTLLSISFVIVATLVRAGVTPGASTSTPLPSNPSPASTAALSANVPQLPAAPGSNLATPRLHIEQEVSPLSTPADQLKALQLTRDEKRLARRMLKQELKQLVALHRAERRGESSVASASAAPISPVGRAQSDLRYRLIVGLIGIAGAIVFYAVGEPVAGTILLILGLAFFGWWLIDYL